MPHGRPPERNEDVAALAAVWGREASATAVPQERPPTGPPPRPRRFGPRHLLVAGAAVGVVVAIAVAVVVIGGDEDDRPTDRREGNAPSTTAPWEPTWTTEVTCPRLEVSPELRTSACPVATDDERVYVLEARDDPAADDPVTTLVATGAADGREAWAVPFPDGAHDVLRYPSVVMVVSPDATSALDPVTGEVRWTAPGHPVAPLGRDHLLLRLDATDADGNGMTTMTVVDAGTGAPDLSRSGPAPSLTIHPCADAGLVLVSEPGRLTAHDIVDGAERWSVDAQYHDNFHPMVCTADVVIALEGDDLLVARDLRSGDEVARAETAVPGDRGLVDLLDLAGGTVVIRADERLVGFSADAVLAALWQIDLPAGGREAVLGAAGEGVTVALLGDRAVWYGPDAAVGSEVSLAGTGHDEAVIEADQLISWGAEDVLVAPANDLGRARVLPLADVRRAAVSSTHLVLTTRDEVRLYPL